MNQLFRLKNEKVWKSLLLFTDKIQLANTAYKTPEEFEEKYAEKGFLKNRLEIAFADIKEVRHPEKDSANIRIVYTKNNKNVNLDLILNANEEQQQLVSAITRPKKMIASTNQVSVIKAIGAPLLGFGLTALFTFIIYIDADIIEAGGSVDTSGRRSLYKQLFAWLGEKLGTQGTLLAGGALALLCIYFIYKNLQSRPMEVIYS